MTAEHPGVSPDADVAAGVERFLASHESDLIALRRQLHRHPEVAWSEHRTSALVAESLARVGLEPRYSHGTGLVFDVMLGGDAAGAGRTIAIRGDMDALPIQDAKTAEYRSEVPGVSHACGHDAHTAIVVGLGLAAVELAASFPPGRLRLIFQPAEEEMPGGGEALSELGVMDGTASIFGLHCDPALPVGTIGISPGPTTWGCDTVRIVLHGPGGHTARPHLTVDLISVIADVAVRLPQLMAAKDPSADPVRLVFGEVHSGTTPNSIPTTAELVGTVRTSNRPAWQAAGRWIEESLRGLASRHGAEFELNVLRGSPPVENDPACAEVMAAAARRVLGPDAVVSAPQSGGADDFAWYLVHAPGAYGRLGVRTPGAPSAPDLHTATFDIDERAIATGVRVLASVVGDSLSQH